MNRNIHKTIPNIEINAIDCPTRLASRYALHRHRTKIEINANNDGVAAFAFVSGVNEFNPESSWLYRSIREN